MAQTAGRIMLRAADADVIPMQFAGLSTAVSAFVDDVEKLVDSERAETAELRRLMALHAFALASDPQAPEAAPADLGDVPRLDFGALKAAALRLRLSAKAYDEAFERSSSENFRLPSTEVAELNGLLQGMEQTLLSKRGLPGRDWYQHMVYAPGAYTGYGVKTLPGIREAIELRHWSEATDYIPVVAGVLNGAAVRLEEAARQLTPRLGSGPARGVGTTPTPTPPPDS
jgi:N-acetylated-alpha-linked acidic dipeptidase